LSELDGLIFKIGPESGKLLPLKGGEVVERFPVDHLEAVSVRLLDKPPEGILGLDHVAFVEITETFLKLNPLLALLVEAAAKRG
jgi:hypothetical protein